MSKPMVAIIGKPNVGKSTFFNYIVGQRLSIVEDTPGVTRDRIYAETNWRGRNFTLIDTGGIEPDSDDIILSQMREQANLAIAMADVIIFLTDIRQGVTAADREISLMLKKSGKPIVLVCNKADNYEKDSQEIYEFYNLGIGEPFAISATNALGIGDVLDAIYEHFPEKDENEEEKEIIKVAVIGKPNVGKSSLINKILGEKRNIVSDIAGTTRDTLEESISLDGVILNLTDTAGIRDTEDIVEKIGIEKAMKCAGNADLIIYVADATRNLDDNDKKILDFVKGRHVIVLLNKTDVENVLSVEQMREHTDFPVLAISAREQTGIRELSDTIRQMFFAGQISSNDQIYITNARHKNMLKESINSLKLVKESIENGMPEDCYTIDLLNAYESLGKIIGQAVEDDLVNQIFSKFCMGK